MRFVDIPGVFWRVGKGRFICGFLIFLVSSVVLKRVELRFRDMSGVFCCVENGRIMCDLLIFLMPSGVLKKVE